MFCGYNAVVRVYVITPFGKLQKVVPAVTPDYFVDDFTGAATGSMQKVLKDTVKFAKALRQTGEQELEAHIAIDKAAVVASSHLLARAARSEL